MIVLLSKVEGAHSALQERAAQGIIFMRSALAAAVWGEAAVILAEGCRFPLVLVEVVMHHFDTASNDFSFGQG